MKNTVTTSGKKEQGDTAFYLRSILFGLILVFALTRHALAEEIKTIEITIKNHQFFPSEIHVQTGQPTILKLKNEDATPEEFDSSALKVEKVIAGGGSARMRLRPLGAGRYPFVGEYHSDTAQGVVIAE